MIEWLSVITLSPHEIGRAIRFYQALGSRVIYNAKQVRYGRLTVHGLQPKPSPRDAEGERYFHLTELPSRTAIN